MSADPDAGIPFCALAYEKGQGLSHADPRAAGFNKPGRSQSITNSGPAPIGLMDSIDFIDWIPCRNAPTIFLHRK
jgi:hypothetical protein